MHFFSVLHPAHSIVLFIMVMIGREKHANVLVREVQKLAQLQFLCATNYLLIRCRWKSSMLLSSSGADGKNVQESNMLCIYVTSRLKTQTSNHTSITPYCQKHLLPLALVIFEF